MPRTVETRFTTANLRNTLNHQDVLADLRPLAQASDVLFLQEMNDRDAQAVMDDLDPGVWKVTQSGAGGAKARVAIAVRANRFRRTTWDVVAMSISRMFPSATRYLLTGSWVDLETGRVWHLANMHAVPHADDDQDPGDLTDLPRRRLVVQGLDAVVRWARLHPNGSAAVMGDFNTDLRADLRHRDDDAPVERLATVGLRNSAAVLGLTALQDTHGHNLYDQGYFRVKPRAGHLASHRVHPKRHSDHRAYTVTVRCTRRRWTRRP